MRRSPFVALASLLVAAIALAPLAVLAARGAAHLANAGNLLTPTLLTLFMGAGGSALAVATGAVLAWLGFRARLHQHWDALVSPAYLIPPFAGGLGWLFALEPFGVRPYGIGGMLLAFTALYSPLAYLLLRAAMESKLPPLVAASTVHGVTGPRLLRVIVSPLGSALGAALVIVYLAIAGNYGIPQVLGAPAGANTLPSIAYARLLSPVRADPLGDAAAAGLMLALVSLPIIALPAARGFGATRQPLRATRKMPARAAFVVFALVAFGIPVFGLAHRALLAPYGGAWQPAFAQAWSLPLVRSGLSTSLALALTTAVVLGGLTLCAAPFSRAMVLAHRVLDVNYVLPGTLLGVGLILLLGRSPLYATPAILLVAYLLHFAPLVARSVEAGLDGGVERAVLVASVHGVSRLRAWGQIGAPLLRPYVVAGMFLVLPLAFSELTLSALLYAPGAETLGVATLSELNGGAYHEAAALGLIALAFSLLALALPRRDLGL